MTEPYSDQELFEAVTELVEEYDRGVTAAEVSDVVPLATSTVRMRLRKLAKGESRLRRYWAKPPGVYHPSAVYEPRQRSSRTNDS